MSVEVCLNPAVGCLEYRLPVLAQADPVGVEEEDRQAAAFLRESMIR